MQDNSSRVPDRNDWISYAAWVAGAAAGGFIAYLIADAAGKSIIESEKEFLSRGSPGLAFKLAFRGSRIGGISEIIHAFLLVAGTGGGVVGGGTSASYLTDLLLRRNKVGYEAGQQIPGSSSGSNSYPLQDGQRRGASSPEHSENPAYEGSGVSTAMPTFASDMYRDEGVSGSGKPEIRKRFERLMEDDSGQFYLENWRRN